VASDSTGNVFLLEEDPGAVYVLDRTLSKGLNRIQLNITAEHPLREDWDKDSNSRGEGFILLKSGHILVAKEKEPPVFVEFGPSADSPQGLIDEKGESAAVGLDDTFPLPLQRDTVFVALKVWTVNGPFLLDGDLGEIAFAPDDSLLLLSDQLRSIFMVPDKKQFQQDSVEVSEMSGLPKELGKPEGLVVTPWGQVLIVVDNHPVKKRETKREPNLFLFNGL
jgi:hypothetical protein